MRKTYYLFSLIAVFSMLAFASCTTSNNNDDDDDQPSTYTYTNDIAPIVTQNCVGCHSGAGASAGLDLTTFAGVKDAAMNGPLLNRINNSSNPMPPSGLMDQSKRDALQAWADDGFLE